LFKEKIDLCVGPRMLRDKLGPERVGGSLFRGDSHPVELVVLSFAGEGTGRLNPVFLRVCNSMFCAYDPALSWEHNCIRGPQFYGADPVVPAVPLKRFLGLPVRSRFGIAAGILPNSNWLLPYARRGFDLLTWKTVRSRARACYPLPNWVLVDDGGRGDGPVTVVDPWQGDPRDVSSAVCFGMPSFSPVQWRADMRWAAGQLLEGQLMIVSVVASPEPDWSVEQIADDFALCAGWAVESGAGAIEANLSCPNVCSAEGSLYCDVLSSVRVVQRIRAAIGEVPLLLKLGVFPADELMVEFLRAVNGLANGVTLGNCVTREVLRGDGVPVFGEGYRRAGVLGRSIHRSTVSTVGRVREVIMRDGLSLELAAVGGVSRVCDAEALFAAGADAVLCGSSPAFLPGLAVEMKQAHPEW
jgi:dihydroorotate dehydrogenase (NAD+) catalytic subunit